MSKERYKGYILDSWSHTSENRSWDGHSSSGDGTYSTSYGVTIYNSKTLKMIKSVDNYKEAKKYVDDHLVGDGLKANRRIHSEMEKLEKKISKKEKELKAFQEQLRFLRCKAPESPKGY